MFLIKKRRSTDSHYRTEQLLYQTDKSSHRRRYIKKLFVKILQYSQENACAEVSFK